MPDLKRTTITNGHYHMVYLRDDGTGETSPADDGHVHDVVLIQDPTGAYISLAPSEGHTHYPLDIPIVEKKDKVLDADDESLIRETHSLLRYAKDIENDFRVNGKKSFDYYNGKQWEESEKRELEASKRPAIVVNEIKPIVLSLSGHQRQNRTDIKAFPIEDADPRGAEIVNVVLKYVLDKCNYAQHESKVFLDQCITGRGIFDAYVTFDENPEGDIKIVRYKWDGIYFGPHECEDLSDLEYLVKTKLYSIGSIKSMYPDKADEIDIDLKWFEDFTGDAHHNVPGDQYRAANVMMPLDMDTELNYDVKKKNVWLLELWRKRFDSKKVLINSEDPYNEFIYQNSDALTSTDRKLAKRIPGFEVKDMPEWKMEVITTAGKTVLDKRVSLLHDFNISAVYASKEDSYIEGKVWPLIGLQDEVNKRTSQAIDVVNRSNNDGWFYDHETFANQTEEEAFKGSANKPGFAIKVRDLRKVPQKVERARFPAELVNMRELASTKMKETAGITQEVLGLESNARSGVAIARRVRQGLITNDYLFDNLSIAKKRLGNILIKMIQDVFTVDRIMKILHNQNAKEAFTMKGPDGTETPFSEIDEAFIRDFLSNMDFTKYDVSISESANSPTKNLDRFQTLTELLASGAMNPMAIELAKQAGIVSPSDADKLLQMLQQQAQQQQEAQKSDQQAQLARTLVAQGLDPTTMQPLPQGANNK